MKWENVFLSTNLMKRLQTKKLIHGVLHIIFFNELNAKINYLLKFH